MKFEVYGKLNCAKCKSTKDKLSHLLTKAALGEAVPLVFVDVDGVEGMAEGAFNDVRDVPTTILRSDAGEPLARWEGKPPLSTEVFPFLGAAKSVSAVQ